MLITSLISLSIMTKKTFFFVSLIIPLISLIGGIWAGQYIDDGYHWGFIFSNALELLNGKTI